MAIVGLVAKLLLYGVAIVGGIFLIWLAFQLLMIAIYLLIRVLVLMVNLALPWRWKEIRFRGWAESRDDFREFKSDFIDSMLAGKGEGRSRPAKVSTYQSSSAAPPLSSPPAPSAPVNNRPSPVVKEQPERVVLEYVDKYGHWKSFGRYSTIAGVDQAMRSAAGAIAPPQATGPFRARGEKTGQIYGMSNFR